ncbi:hypothetical protein LTR10_010060 [Elasticomyces elasticus]|nr:hypothetical protein LTR10_010060 [Elasticomyces elasticus]KAK4970352.1 hypothetical protein LTR42_008519 [Elasticomyces elasticus]
MLRDRVEADTADIETAKVCMTAYFNHLWTMPRRRRRPLIVEGNVGRLTLEWLWSKDHRWSQAVLTDMKFIDNLSYFAVAADLSPSLLKWAAQPFPGTEQLEDNEYRWRGAVVRTVIRAHLILDCAATANDALKEFLDLADRLPEARKIDKRSPLASISLWPSQCELSKCLSTGFYPRTDAKLYDRFIDHCKQDRRTDNLSLATLSIHHPSKPDLAPTLGYIRDHIGPLSSAEFSQRFPPASAISKHMFLILRRTELLLHQQNRLRTAEDVGALIQKFFDEQTQQALNQKMEWENITINNLRRGGGNFPKSRRLSGIGTRFDKKQSEE